MSIDTESKKTAPASSGGSEERATRINKHMAALLEEGEQREAALHARIDTLVNREEELLEFVVEVAFAVGATHAQPDAPSYAGSHEEILAAARSLASARATLTARAEKAERERDEAEKGLADSHDALKRAVDVERERDALRAEVERVKADQDQGARDYCKLRDHADALFVDLEKEKAAHALEKQAHEYGWERDGKRIKEARAESSRLRGAVEGAKASLYELGDVHVFDGTVPWEENESRRAERARRAAHALTAALSPAPAEGEVAGSEPRAALAWGDLCTCGHARREHGMTPVDPGIGECGVEGDCGERCLCTAFALPTLSPAPAEVKAEKPPCAPADGVCCTCGYGGSDEDFECTRRDGTHCVHWWEGPDAEAPTPEKASEGEPCGKRSIYGDVCTEPRGHDGWHHCISGGGDASWGVCAPEKASRT